MMALPPAELVRSPEAWRQVARRLQSEPSLAIDLEANSMFAYQEQVCLIQISIPEQDFIVDPLAAGDLADLGAMLANARVEKIFHAVEYDLILLKRQYGWQMRNLFDTMWAARILGYKRYGLANLLQKLYDVKLNKRYQKSDWCRRPLSPAQLAYAQYDTHFLHQLRHDLGQELAAAGRLEEAAETFAEQTAVEPHNNEFDPESFWSFNGAYDLSPPQQGILRALAVFRDREARRRDQPHFKVLGERTLVELARRSPDNMAGLQEVYGMSKGQVRRYGQALLSVIASARHDPPPTPPRRGRRLPDDVMQRYDTLHTWRKRRAQRRGVESDVIVSRDALWAMARNNPRTMAELAQLNVLGEWRRQTYGQELLQVLASA